MAAAAAPSPASASASAPASASASAPGSAATAAAATTKGASEFVYNFAFGANLQPKTLAGRGVSAEAMIPARCDDYAVRFSLPGLPFFEPGFGSLEHKAGYTTHGVLLKLTPAMFEKLWHTEGGGDKGSYDVAVVDCVTYTGEHISARAFVSRTKGVEGLRPSKRYLNLLVTGAKHHSLDASYIEALQRVPTARKPIIPLILFMLIWAVPVVMMFILFFTPCLRFAVRSKAGHLAVRQVMRLMWKTTYAIEYITCYKKHATAEVVFGSASAARA